MLNATKMDNLKSKWNYSYTFNVSFLTKFVFLYDKEYSEVLVFFIIYQNTQFFYFL